VLLAPCCRSRRGAGGACDRGGRARHGTRPSGLSVAGLRAFWLRDRAGARLYLSAGKHSYKDGGAWARPGCAAGVRARPSD